MTVTLAETFASAIAKMNELDWYRGGTGVFGDATCVGLAIGTWPRAQAVFCEANGIDWRAYYNVCSAVYWWNDTVPATKEEAIAALRKAYEYAVEHPDADPKRTLGDES